MRCPKCNFENPKGVKFCGECGTSLPNLCPTCGFENPSSFKFCGNCGAALTIARPGAAGERRQLTVMFSDIVGFTTLSEQIDPEELRDVLGQYHVACAEVFRKYAGHIAQYLGDGLLVYFGYPAAHEDDARRAVRAGLEILQALTVLNDRLPVTGRRLAVRIGIHTGLVVVGEMGSGDSHEQLALGETPNVAARLQDLAEPDSIVISATTYRLCGQHFHCQALGPHSLKGMSQPIEMYRVTGANIHSQNSVTNNDVTSGLTPLVGRDDELATLLALWQKAETGDGQVVFINGEAGIGKSRLTQTFGRRAARIKHAKIEMRCSPYYQNSALYPVIDAIQRYFNFDRADTMDSRLNRLTQSLATLNTDIKQQQPLAAALLSLPHDTIELTSQQQKERTLEGLVAALLAVAAEQPVLVLVEDLHWSDPSTIELLQLAVARTTEARILFLLTSRPEFTLPWRSLPNLTTLSLRHLAARQTQLLVERMAGHKALPPEVLQQIVTKTDGVPLFVEELTRMVLESGLIREEADRYVLIGPLPPLAIPSTLRDSLMARLDKLATVKEIAQIGSVIGREFSFELIRAVSEMSDIALQKELWRLVDAGLLYQGGVPPLATYIFKHALIQETAYRSLLRSKRQQFHLKIVQSLESKFPETVNTQPEVLAHHYTEAGLNEQAIDYWQKAGQRASQRSAHTEAAHHLNRGLELLKTLPESPHRNVLELDMLTSLGRTLIASKGLGSPDAVRAYERARELCQVVGETPQLFPVLRGLNLFYIMRGELQTAHELGNQLLRLGTTLNDTAVLVPAYHALGTSTFYLGEFDRARAYYQQGLALYDPQKHRSLAQRYGFDPGVTSLSWLAWTLWYLGHPDQALKAARGGLALARDINHPLSIAYALQYLARVHQYRREQKATLETAEASIQVSIEHGFPDWLAQGKVLVGWARVEAGEIVDGLELIKEGLNAYEANGAQVGRPYFMGLLAQAYQRAGQLEAGLQTLNEALAAVSQHGHRYYEAELKRLRGEFTLEQCANGNLREAEIVAQDDFRQALALAREQNARSLELRVATSRMRAFHGGGEGLEQGLSKVYGWFTEGSDTPDLSEAKALLTKYSS